MNLIDHSDFSWLVLADWLEERGNLLSDYIRFQVEEDLDTWNDEYCLRSVSVGGVSEGIGGCFGGIGFGIVVGVGGVVGNFIGGSVGGVVSRSNGVGGNGGFI